MVPSPLNAWEIKKTENKHPYQFQNPCLPAQEPSRRTSLFIICYSKKLKHTLRPILRHLCSSAHKRRHRHSFSGLTARREMDLPLEPWNPRILESSYIFRHQPITLTGYQQTTACRPQVRLEKRVPVPERQPFKRAALFVQIW